MTDRVFIYGAGRIGRSLGAAIQSMGEAHGLKLCGAWNRSFKRAFATSRLLDVEVSSGDALPDQALKADIIILSVADDAIVTMAEGLARHLSHKQRLIHTSGCLPSTIMSVNGMKAHLGGCHPLQSIPGDDGDWSLFQGATFAIEGHADACNDALRISAAAGARPITITPEGKIFYHAAAVISANYLTVLTDAARTLYQQAGLDASTAVHTLLPLLRGTLHNLEAAAGASPDSDDAGLAGTLTGPIRRGDINTVKRHLKALRKLPRSSEHRHLIEIYTALGKRAADISHRDGLDAEATGNILKVLGGTPETT